MEHLTCGYIKAKFDYDPGKPLSQQRAYVCFRQYPTFRVTPHHMYVQFGHSAIRDNDHAIDIIKSIESVGGKITRLDLCIDIMGLFPYDDYYDIHDVGTPPYPALIKSPHGKTVYIGKRSSARYLRIYNKRAEIQYRKKIDVGFDFYRIELEVKRNAVPQYKRLFLAGNESVILADLAARYGLGTILGQGVKMKPTDIPDKASSVWSFIHRYRRIIKEAYTTDLEQFQQTIGV